MNPKAKSRTEKEVWVEEAIIGESHYVTTISNGEHKVEGRGRTAEEAEEIASEKWEALEDEEEEEEEEE